MNVSAPASGASMTDDNGAGFDPAKPFAADQKVSGPSIAHKAAEERRAAEEAAGLDPPMKTPTPKGSPQPHRHPGQQHRYLAGARTSSGRGLPDRGRPRSSGP